MDADQLDLLRRLIVQYKGIRPYIAEGDLYHLVGPSNLNDPWDGGWLGVQYHEATAEKTRNPTFVTAKMPPRQSPLNCAVWIPKVSTGGHKKRGNRRGDGTGMTQTKLGLPVPVEPRLGNWLLYERIG